jgi:DNA-binding CsgD family transcriptional regulator
MLVEDPIAAPAHDVPRRPRPVRATPAPRADVLSDRRLLLAVLSDPARVTAGAVEQLDHEIRRLWTETDPDRIVRTGAAALVLGRCSSCRVALWTVVDGGRDTGAVIPRIRALSLLCADDFLTGQWDECARLADEGTALCAGHGHRLLAGPFQLVRGLLAAARGDHATVRALAAEVADRTGPREDLGRAAHLVAASAALADDDPERAYGHARAVGPAGTLPAHDHAALAVATDLVEAARRTGRVDDAARHARAMREAPLAAASPRFAMLALGAHAVAESPDDAAADLFEEALSAPGGERWAFDHARIELAYGSHLRGHRRTAPARRHLESALTTFERLAAEPWTARCRGELRAVGSRVELSRRRWHRRPTLTPDEHEVASLAATGLTNKQIAARLRVSPRTVSARLYQVFPKLGVTSRAALRDALTDLAAP